MTDYINTHEGDILIIDDNPDNLQLLTAVLKNRGYQVHNARTGNEGLTYIRSKSPDLILLDIKLPDLSGYEICEQLKSDNKTKDIPIIFLSALDNTANKIKGFEAGGVDYITKPFSPKEVLVRVQTHLEISRLRLQTESQVSKLELMYEQLQGEIVERERISESLSESEEEYRILFESSPDAYLIIVNGVFTDCNHATELMLRCNRTQIIGKSPVDFAPELQPNERKSSELAEEMIEKALHLGKNAFEWMNRRFDGSTFMVDMSIASIKINRKQALFTSWRDITELKQAEKENQRINAQLRILSSAIEQSPVTTVITDVKGNIEYVNPKFSEITGYTAEEAIGQNPKILKASKKSLAEYKELWDTIISGHNWHGVFQNKKKSGELYWESAVISPVKDEKGTITHFLAVKEDITKRKLMEMALRESNELLTLFIKHSPIYAFIKEVTPTTSRVLMVSENFKDMVGIPASEMVGKTMEELFPPEIAAKFTADDWAVVSSGKVLKLDEDLNDRNHTTIKFPILLEGKSLLAGYSIDITDRKLAEKEIINAREKAEESDKFNKALLQTIPFGMDIVDETGTILFLSDNFKQYFGDNALTKKCWEIYRDDKKQCANCPLYSGIEIGKTNIYEAHGVLGGKTFDIIHTGMIFKEKKAMLEIYMDITERKKNELIIQNQNQELVRLNADKNHFISILAHDLKSPFNVILGYLDLLIENIHIYDIDSIENHIQTINTSAQNTYNLLEDILMWARTQSGKIPFNPKDAKLNELLNEILESLIPIAIRKNITISHSLLEGVVVFADIDMLKTILRNLVSNAIKFTNPDGRINISIKQQPNYQIISVSDNGVGIPSETINKLFDASQTITTKGTANEGGTGLGLTLCKEFVEKHGGKIWVESEVGKGSTFYFTLAQRNK